VNRIRTSAPSVATIAIRLLGDRVLIRPDAPDEKAGSLFIPDSAKKPSGTGVVVAMGPGMLTAVGGRWPMPDCAIGDRIVYGRDAREVQQKIKIDGVEYLKMHDDDILAVVEP
jgi:co-chaperonin GroES (HSP10)